MWIYPRNTSHYKWSGGGTYLFERGLRHDRAMKMLVDAKPYPAQLLYEIGWAMRVLKAQKKMP